VCKSNTSTTATTSPNPQALNAYSNLLGQAGSVASTPYQAYGGQLVAPVNQQQNLGIGNINQNAGFASPFIGQAAQYANQAAQPVTGAQIAGFQSPYTQQVVNATEAQFNNQNAQQQSQLTGNAVAAGAMGGDRAGVAAANLAGQQQTAEAPVIAGLENTGYQNASQMALAEQQNTAQAAYSLGNLGVAGQNAALTGANAQVGAGSLEQQTQQAQDTAAYQQFEQQLAYPFQTTQWLAGIDTGVGSQMGGQSQTTAPPPNPYAQYAGLGLAGAGLLLKRGGRVPGFDLGGATDFIAGTPYSGVQGWVPTNNITAGKGAPNPPSVAGQAVQNPLQQANQALTLGKALQGKGLGLGDSGILTGGDALGLTPDQYAAASDAGVSGLSSPDEGSYRRGGFVRGYDNGGDVVGDGGALMPIMGPDGLMSGLGGSDTPPPFTFRRTPDFGADEPAMFGAPSSGQVGYAAPNMSLAENSFAPSQPSDAGAIGDYDFTANRPATVMAAGDDVPLPRPRPDDTSDIGTPVAYAPDSRDPDRLAGFAPVPGTNGAPALPPSSGANSRFSGLGNLLSFSPAAKQGLLAAGLGMLASGSPHFGVAVGQGGLQGLNAYAGELKQESADKKTDATIEHARKQLEQHAKETADKLALETKKLSQAQEFHQDTVKHQDQLAAEAQRLHDIQMKRIEAQIEQGNYSATPGRGQDEKGNPVEGSWLLNKKSGETKFVPGMVQTPKATAAGEPSFDKNTLTKMSDQYLAGDKSVLVNLGRGAQGATDLRALRQRIAERMDEKGVSPEQQAVKMAEFGGLAAGERALGTRTATIEMAANEARNMMKPALEAAAAVPRSSWVPVNKLIEGWQSGVISDPAQARFAAANFSLVNTYVRAIAPTGVPPESARNHAMQMLSGAMSHESYKAVVDQMDIEMDAALKSPGQVQQKFREMYGGAPAAAHSAAPAGNQNAQAIQWANANPNDPRAAEIKRRLGVQ
jgi:hypothetical protein